MHWNDPNWVAAYGQWAGAIASVLAVVAALLIALYSGRQAQKQFRASMVPRLAIANNDKTNIWIERTGLYLNWQARHLFVTMKNIGGGPAFNIASVIYGAESYPGDPGKPRMEGQETHWTLWADSLMQPGESNVQQYNLGASTFYKDKQYINAKRKQYQFHAPAVPDFQLQNPLPRYIARIVTTYQDIYGNKHASIFDADDMGRLKQVAFSENINEDLYDLQG